MHIVTILRYYLGLTQSELAEKAGIAYADLNEIETKPNYGTINKYQKLAQFLHIPVHTVVTNDILGVPESFFDEMPAAKYKEPAKSKTGILGRQGEDFAFQLEKDRLNYENPKLSKLVLPRYKLRSFYGYDILSYKENGTPFFIEVKTSKSNSNSVHLTKFEYDTAKKWTARGYDYWIYSYSNWGTQEQRFEQILFRNLQRAKQIEPERYICSLKERKSTENGILHFRKQMGISQIEAANLLEIPVSSLCKYETGENQCPVTVYQKLARLYQTTIDFLLEDYPCA